MHTLKLLYELPRSARPAPAECLFLSTHEPCSMCLSAITWAGYDNFHYLFSHEESRDDFAIPHDLRILKEVFRLDAGGYAKIQRVLDQRRSRGPDRRLRRGQAVANSCPGSTR